MTLLTSSPTDRPTTRKPAQPEKPPTRQPGPAPIDIDATVLDLLQETLVRCFGKFPRKSGTGPGSSRYEHWEPLVYDNEHATEVALCLARLVTGDMPETARDAYLSARLAGIAKKDNGTRVLGCGNTART